MPSRRISIQRDQSLRVTTLGPRRCRRSPSIYYNQTFSEIGQFKLVANASMITRYLKLDVWLVFFFYLREPFCFPNVMTYRVSWCLDPLHPLRPSSLLVLRLCGVGRARLLGRFNINKGSTRRIGRRVLQQSVTHPTSRSRIPRPSKDVEKPRPESIFRPRQ